MRGVLQNGLYILQGSIVVGTATPVSDSSIQRTKLWHWSLVHISEKDLQELEKQG